MKPYVKFATRSADGMLFLHLYDTESTRRWRVTMENIDGEWVDTAIEQQRKGAGFDPVPVYAELPIGPMRGKVRAAAEEYSRRARLQAELQRRFAVSGALLRADAKRSFG